MNEENQQVIPSEVSGPVTDQDSDVAVNAQNVGRPRRSRARKLVVFAVCVAGGVLVLLIANVPPHVSIEPHGSSMLLPDPGYTWRDPNDTFNWQVHWTPGMHNPTLSNVLAAAEEGSWRPAPGYAWTDTVIHKETAWVPNTREMEFPHVVAGDKPDNWILDPGYVAAGDWSSINPRTIWKVGIRDYRFPHIESAAEEDHWLVDPGYTFADGATRQLPRVVWQPGQRRTDSPHAFASASEGMWLLDEGYRWLNRNNPNDFRVVSPARIVGIWNQMIYADFAVNQMSCSSLDAVQAAIETARGRYGAIYYSESHPLLESHIRNAYAVLVSAATAFQNCRTADNVGDVVDGIGTIACLFADDREECMRKKNMLINGGGAIVSVACQEAGKNARSEFDRITGERRDLQSSLEEAYSLRLPVTQLVACR